MKNVRIKLTLPLVAIFLTVACLVFFMHRQDEPEVVETIDNPIRPKKIRPMRKTPVQTEQMKKMNEKSVGAIEAASPASSRCVNTTYNESTGIRRKEYDEDCDGIADKCVLEELNEYEEPIRIESYIGCGNFPTFCSDLKYNEYGEGIASYFDENCNGVIDICITAKRNDHGDVVESVYDYKCDGNMDDKNDLLSCFSYSYDEEGMIVGQVIGKCGQEPENCVEYDYDFHAGVQRETWDYQCDGAADFCWVKIYRDDHEDRGDLTDSDDFTDKGCDGIWSWCSVHGDGGVIHKFKGHEACAQQYEELVKKNMGSDNTDG